MEILFAASEVFPFSKVGGLGDVCGALPKALRAFGHRVVVVSPLYRGIDPARHSLARRLSPLRVDLGGEAIDLSVFDGKLPSGVEIVLLAHEGLYGRDGIYGNAQGDFADNPARFAVLSRAALEVAARRERRPQILHVHDWPTALVPFYLRQDWADDERLGGARTVLTLHNAAFQGLAPAAERERLGIDPELFTPDGVEFHGQLSLLKAGIITADRLVAVSPTYARELLTERGGHGLHGLFAARASVLTGILNGIDPGVWNPATDPAIASRYDAADLRGKAFCKSDLQRQMGLPLRSDVPLFGIVSRLTAQKGFDLFAEVAARLLRTDVQFVVLGEGDPSYVELFEDLSKRFADRLAFRRAYDEPLAHRIFAGADLVLIPSRFEPCGLTQMYALRYGAVPVARAVGGLKDTIVDTDGQLATGNGFLFWEESAAELSATLLRAAAAFAAHERFRELTARAMRLGHNHGWEHSARLYEELYRALAADGS